MRTVRLLVAALAATLATAGSLIAADAPVVRRVVMAGQPAPGGGTFDRFSVESLPIVAPMNSRGQVAFFATVVRGRASEGFFLASEGRVIKIAVDGDRAPGGGTFTGFGRHPIAALNDKGSVAFAAAVAGGRTVEGIFLAASRRLESVAVAGGPAPGVASGTLAVLDSPSLNDRNDVAFLATIRRGRESLEAIYLRADGRLRKVVAQGDPAPAGGTFSGFGAPVVNNRRTVAFAAVVEGPAVPGGVFLAEGGKIRMAVGAGDDTPIGGIFAKLSERIALNDAGAVAFSAILKNGPTEAATFAIESGRIRKVAALGDGAPGGGVFSYLGLWPVLSRSGAVGVVASVDHGPSPVAVFVTTRTGLAKVVGVGDALPTGGTIESFGLYPALAMGPGGSIVFATGAGQAGAGAEGLFLVSPPPDQ